MIQQTSIQAYLNDVLPTLGDRQKEVYRAIRDHENITNSELASYLNWPINTITPRVNELVDKHLVIEDRKRICKVTGRRVIAWALIRNTLF